MAVSQDCPPRGFVARSIATACLCSSSRSIVVRWEEEEEEEEDGGDAAAGEEAEEDPPPAIRGALESFPPFWAEANEDAPS